MSVIALTQLINSLSKSEKRTFKLETKKLRGEKQYQYLFDLIDRDTHITRDALIKNFEKTYPNAAFDVAVQYLFRRITDTLINSKSRKEQHYNVYYGLQQINLLKERNLAEEAYKLLLQLKKKAATMENLPLQYIIQREELDYLSTISFKGVPEKNLIELQVSAREILREIRNTQEHYSLYESLIFRIMQLESLSPAEVNKMDDLILSELSIVNAREKQNLETQKIHLLFQSLFLNHTGDYKSSLKTFYDLNRLFERNPGKWKHPPLDYFSVLDGILQNLRSINQYDKMDFYIDKLKQLDRSAYPEHFTFLVKKTVLLYELAFYNATGQAASAVTHIARQHKEVWQLHSLSDPDKQTELCFYTALSFFNQKELKKAARSIQTVVLTKRDHHLSAPRRACMLLNIMIHYENRDFEFLDYEIRSYKRLFNAQHKMHLLEQFIFKTVKVNPVLHNMLKRRQLWDRRFAPLQDAIKNDKNENLLLCYFDFTQWAWSKFK